MKGGKQLIGKRNSYEIVRLENELVIFQLALECFRDDDMVRLVMQE